MNEKSWEWEFVIEIPYGEQLNPQPHLNSLNHLSVPNSGTGDFIMHDTKMLSFIPKNEFSRRKRKIYRVCPPTALKLYGLIAEGSCWNYEKNVLGTLLTTWNKMVREAAQMHTKHSRITTSRRRNSIAVIFTNRILFVGRSSIVLAKILLHHWLAPMLETTAAECQLYYKLRLLMSAKWRSQRLSAVRTRTSGISLSRKINYTARATRHTVITAVW